MSIFGRIMLVFFTGIMLAAGGSFVLLFAAYITTDFLFYAVFTSGTLALIWLVLSLAIFEVLGGKRLGIALGLCGAAALAVLAGFSFSQA
ncbi:hypothetical protein [Alteribacter natronophilus]|uniref:hypothetical protein n=1 Tax=Alteribacter natronophilus TaxID=2583810 RepID=UPI00110E3E85|nr:hypothetical protein [Alteribacter natronophilus]TMW71461.1 hypothetical protein FGB90_10470 [Alteribacter natronophilus]